MLNLDLHNIPVRKAIPHPGERILGLSTADVRRTLRRTDVPKQRLGTGAQGMC